MAKGNSISRRVGSTFRALCIEAKGAVSQRARLWATGRAATHSVSPPGGRASDSTSVKRTRPRDLSARIMRGESPEISTTQQVPAHGMVPTRPPPLLLRLTVMAACLLSPVLQRRSRLCDLRPQLVLQTAREVKRGRAAERKPGSIRCVRSSAGSGETAHADFGSCLPATVTAKVRSSSVDPGFRHVAALCTYEAIALNHGDRGPLPHGGPRPGDEAHS